MTTLVLHDLPDPDTMPEFYDGVPSRRALAWVVDVTVVFIFSLLLLPLTLFIALFFFPVMMMGVGFIYRWFTIASGSATWGMRLFNIELRDAQGARLSSGAALAHTAGYALSVITFPLQLVSIGAMAITPKRQGLTDFVMGTTAINRPA
ncbi:RDD family protein [Loktanella sp. SALINAS62]|uniref:RDD family protein n=1 Tax=Loktanella sp. SALINAS62 TaxID=2706124 RepID=UPI001B8D9244|nr:RDD family protein [Loktanella sp. SALINAS62]MBS1303564.1 RDD family protein [Loktanella sp. SALINAS62]